MTQDIPATTSNASQRAVKSRNLRLSKLAFRRKAITMMLDSRAEKHQASVGFYKKRMKRKMRISSKMSGFQDKPQILYELVEGSGR